MVILFKNAPKIVLTEATSGDFKFTLDKGNNAKIELNRTTN